MRSPRSTASPGTVRALDKSPCNITSGGVMEVYVLKLRENELKVFYSGKVDRVLDLAIEDVLKTFGYRRWASGWTADDSVRDLAFEQKVTKN